MKGKRQQNKSFLNKRPNFIFKPTRNAHPVIKFKCDPSEPMIFNDLPFDKYELEPSPLTQYILERKQPLTCWQVFVEKSGKYGELGHPFGYLKASSTLNCVNLFVMPYNYPTLVPLLSKNDNFFIKNNFNWGIQTHDVLRRIEKRVKRKTFADLANEIRKVHSYSTTLLLYSNNSSVQSFVGKKIIVS